MKHLFRIFLMSVFLLSSTTDLLTANINQRGQGKKVTIPGKAGVTYIKVAKDLVKKNMKGKLSKSELRVVEEFIKGKRQNPRDVKHLESAIKKHSCFVQLNRKSKNLTMFPRAKSLPKWFAIDCAKSANKRPGSRGGLGNNPNNPNANSGGGATTNNGGATN